ncbi:MAG: U32 family peptidase [Bacteroidales bacterium]|nr:U32 family peptidase [Bacteroidales bacterium]
MQLELLSPAKNYIQGREAINHGADAVYIGAPAFGARVAAGNSIEEIEELAKYAHLYHAKVFATVNTLLFDNEIDDAVKMLHQLYNAGVDAAIIQDLGLLECDLPPIELHASTQTHNASVERVKFLEQVGFSRVILARETSLSQMEEIRRETTVELESFIQGALCVSYSGQCYMSQYLDERSGNRGCCGQPCRSSYDLYDEHRNLLRKSQHLLSLKDFSASKHIRQMIAAGITSFKIEGRLKDLSYVKNVTAYYRQLLDDIMVGTEHTPASSGHCRFFFMPDLEKTFNRGFTDYFLQERKPMANMLTPKSMGKKMGQVTKVATRSFTIKSREPLIAGDGLCFINDSGELEGFYVNHVEGDTITPNRMADGIKVGTTLWRNNDQAFEKLLQGRSSIRTVMVDMLLSETTDGLRLDITDTDGCTGTAAVTCSKEEAQNPAKTVEQTHRNLAKLGDTIFEAANISMDWHCAIFIPASTINDLRRRAVRNLEEARKAWHLSQRGSSPSLIERQQDTTPYYESVATYQTNIINEKCRQFYLQHGVEKTEYGLEKSHDYSGKDLMTTKYCLRYELGCCLKKKPKDWTVEKPDSYKGNLLLRNNRNWFSLSFDCKNCLVRIRLSKS